MNPYFLLGAALACACAFGTGYWQGDTAGQAKIQQKWDHEKTAQMAEYAKAQEEARKREQDLQANADKLRKEKDNEIRNISARATDLSNSLQQRPDRPAESGSVSGSASACVGSSGAQLARSDAIFLAGYSADAARLQAALDQCVKQYEAMRK
jgi:hypothetical protein